MEKSNSASTSEHLPLTPEQQEIFDNSRRVALEKYWTFGAGAQCRAWLDACTSSLHLYKAFETMWFNYCWILTVEELQMLQDEYKALYTGLVLLEISEGWRLYRNQSLRDVGN